MLRTTPARPDIDWREWAASGARWQGGTIAGIRGRLDYLQGLGVTTLWIGPVFKQRARLDTFHGYGVQDFLEVDPRFGSREDLVDLCEDAHARGLRIILDIIVNHTGDNWGYVPPGDRPRRAAQRAAVPGVPAVLRRRRRAGRRLEHGAARRAPAGLDARRPASTTASGRSSCGRRGTTRGPAPARSAPAGSTTPHAEHKRTDFFALKDLALDGSDTLSALVDCYKYWIALSDCDGFRLDTVKHLSLEEARNFCGALREFADRLGKRNFLIVGEIAGGDDVQDFVIDHLAAARRNLTAALDIGGARLILTDVAKGLRPAADYFAAFDEASRGFESHRAFGDRHVSILDDHDHVFGRKLRFSAEIPDASPVKDRQIVAATAIQLFALGIPCIYYGTEQAFAGPGREPAAVPGRPGLGRQRPLPARGDVRAGAPARAARRGSRHAGPRARRDAARLRPVRHLRHARLRPGAARPTSASPRCARRGPAIPSLRVGRQYQRAVRVFGDFALPAAGELIAWSRILDTDEAVVVVNPNGDAARGGQVVVAGELSRVGDEFLVVVNTAEAGAAPGAFTGPHPAGSRRRRARPALRRRAGVRRDRSAAAGGSPRPGEDPCLIPDAGRSRSVHRAPDARAASLRADAGRSGGRRRLVRRRPGAGLPRRQMGADAARAGADRRAARSGARRRHDHPHARAAPDVALHRAGRYPLGARRRWRRASSCGSRTMYRTYEIDPR